MDKRYRNLGVLVIIIVFAVAVYFLVPYGTVPEPQPPQSTLSFDSGYAEIKSIWIDVGLSDSYMSLNDLEFVDLMTKGQIASLEENLANYGSEIAGKNPAVESLTDIYLDSAKLFAEYKSLTDSLDEMPLIETGELCVQLAQIDSDKNEVIEYINSATKLSGKIDSFKQKYPSEANKVNLTALALNKNDFAQAKAMLEQSIMGIKNFCGVEV